MPVIFSLQLVNNKALTDRHTSMLV